MVLKRLPWITELLHTSFAPTTNKNYPKRERPVYFHCVECVKMKQKSGRGMTNKKGKRTRDREREKENEMNRRNLNTSQNRVFYLVEPIAMEARRAGRRENLNKKKSRNSKRFGINGIVYPLSASTRATNELPTVSEINCCQIGGNIGSRVTVTVCLCAMAKAYFSKRHFERHQKNTLPSCLSDCMRSNINLEFNAWMHALVHSVVLSVVCEHTVFVSRLNIPRLGWNAFYGNLCDAIATLPEAQYENCDGSASVHGHGQRDLLIVSL